MLRCDSEVRRELSPFPSHAGNCAHKLDYPLHSPSNFLILIMTTIAVKLPKYGAISDFYELKYICALHQTGREIRKDGSIRAEDIALFLSSRYGIKNAPTHDMLRSFCLTNKEEVKNNEAHIVPHLQLAEIASILLIPFLIKSFRSLNSADVPRELSEIDSQQDKPGFGLDAELTMDGAQSDTIARCMMWTVTQDCMKWIRLQGERMHVGLLTQDSMKSILQKFGLHHLAEDQDLVHEMVQCCWDGSSDQVIFDVKPFIKALTHDVLLFDVRRELEFTTNFYDVFHSPRAVFAGSTMFKRPNKTIDKISDWNNKTSCLDSTTDEEGFCRIQGIEDNVSTTVSNNGNQTNLADVTKSWTFSCIDDSADTMRTKFLKFILILGFLAVINSQTNYVDSWAEEVKNTCQQNYAMYTTRQAFCEVGTSIGTYFLRGLVIGLIGWIYVGLGSLGNSVHERSVIPLLFSILVILGFNLYFLIGGQESMTHDGKLIPLKFDDEGQESASKIEDQLKAQPKYAILFTFLSNLSGKVAADVSMWKEQKNYAVVVFHYLSIALGFLAILVQLISLLRITLLRNIGKHENYRSILFRHQIVRAEARLKQACSRKLNLLVENAREVYNLGRLITEDPDRDVRRRGVKIFRTALNESKTERKEINVFWALQEVYSGNLLEKHGIWISSRAFSAKYFQYAAMLWFFLFGLSLAWAAMTGTPEVNAFNIKVSSIIGAIVGLLNMTFITSRYFPVYIATVLKLRSGLLQSLDSEEFERYRAGTDNTWLILGFSFWGPIISSFMVSFIVMIVIYCFMDQNLRSSAIFFISTLAGLWIALGIRVLFLRLLQKRFMGGFYRTDPATSNVFGLFFECWNLFLALGYTAFRVVKIVCLAIFHAGRIDSPVLAKRTSPVPLIRFLVEDSAPDFFIQDCLLHEAHRHPYIELLGKCYLYKLRYGDQFMNRAGACWRLLFTLSLLPWLDSSRFEECYDVSEYEKAVASASTTNLQVEEQQMDQKAASTRSHRIDEQPLEQKREEADIVVDAEIGEQGFDQQISCSLNVEPPITVAGMQQTAHEALSSPEEYEDTMNEFLYENLILTDEELYFCRPEDWIQKVQKDC